MSWLSISVPNPFKTLQFSDDESEQQSQSPNSPVNQVPDDLSAIGKTIGRQFRGFAAFLAPPPPGIAVVDDGDCSSPSSKTLAGIRSDLAEFGNSAVNGISKFASGILQLNEEEEDNGNDKDDCNEGVGIRDEVIEFATRISNRPELWTDFPLELNQEFDMSDVQSEHASVIEQFVPSLADLRCRLSSDISVNQFWMIYFILVLPRLNDDDMEQLSTPEIVEARESLLLMLQNKRDMDDESENLQPESSSELENKVGDTAMQKTQPVQEVISEDLHVSSTISNESDRTKELIIEDENICPSSSDNNQSVEKADTSEPNKASPNEEIATVDNSNVKVEKHENLDNWLDKNEPSTTQTIHTASKQFQSEDEISFSDLEDDNDLSNRQSDSGTAHSTRASSLEGSNEWVRLNKNVGGKNFLGRGQSSYQDRDSEGEELAGWLTVDDFDP